MQPELKLKVVTRSGRWKNIQQKKNYKNYKISSVIEGVYSRVQSIEKKRKFGECKKGSSKIWRKTKCKSKIIKEVKYDWRKKL